MIKSLLNFCTKLVKARNIMGGMTLHLLLVLMVSNAAGATNSSPKGLSYNFYEKTCPNVEDIVRETLVSVIATDLTSPAALLRLMFHDCQVQGCDASILLDSSSNSPEIEASKNFGIRKREAIDLIKSSLETECPRQVSCADILVLAAREAVAISGGPKIIVPLGRRDSSSALTSELAETSLPSAGIGLDEALHLFGKLGLTTEDFVAIIGAHTLGVTHCVNVMDRLYKPSSSERFSNVDPNFEVVLRLSCPEGISLATNASFVLNDPSTLKFDNWYFKNIVAGRGVLRIDTELPSSIQTANIVQKFAEDNDSFFKAFGSAFVKLSSAGVLTGNKGVIRTVCNSVD